jgi:hypothetical protein
MGISVPEQGAYSRPVGWRVGDWSQVSSCRSVVEALGDRKCFRCGVSSVRVAALTTTTQTRVFGSLREC